MTKRFTSERRQLIMDLLTKQKRITVKQLAHALTVSEVTLRSDLNEMEKQGYLTRTHGGAILNEPIHPEDSFLARSQKKLDEKMILCEKALQLIEEKSCIILDASTTALELAKLLKQSKMKLTVVTNGMSSAIELKENPYLTVILIGGVLRAGSMALEGLVGIDVLDKINVIDYMFTSSSGFTTKDGLTDFNVYEVDLKKTMVEKAKHVVALLDDSKFNHSSISTFATIDDIHTIITNKQPDKETEAAIKAQAIRLIY